MTQQFNFQYKRLRGKVKTSEAPENIPERNYEEAEEPPRACSSQGKGHSGTSQPLPPTPAPLLFKVKNVHNWSLWSDPKVPFSQGSTDPIDRGVLGDSGLSLSIWGPSCPLSPVIIIYQISAPSPRKLTPPPPKRPQDQSDPPLRRGHCLHLRPPGTGPALDRPRAPEPPPAGTLGLANRSPGRTALPLTERAEGAGDPSLSRGSAGSSCEPLARERVDPGAACGHLRAPHSAPPPPRGVDCACARRWQRARERGGAGWPWRGNRRPPTRTPPPGPPAGQVLVRRR